MSQVYHSNAKTNQHSREIIQHSSLNNIELSTVYGVSVKTISKWNYRDCFEEELPLEGIKVQDQM